MQADAAVFRLSSIGRCVRPRALRTRFSLDRRTQRPADLRRPYPPPVSACRRPPTSTPRLV